jgi:uncharacterized protein (DUF2141 family)
MNSGSIRPYIKSLIAVTGALAFSAISAGFTAARADEPGSISTRAEGVSTIILLVDNIRSAEGQVCFALFPEDGDLSEPDTAVRNGCGEITASPGGRLKSEIRIPEVTYGQYALAVFHDKNDNEVLDTRRFLGFDIPTEDFGFSNNPSVGTSGPSLSDALFTIDRSFYGLGIALKKPPL